MVQQMLLWIAIQHLNDTVYSADEKVHVHLHIIIDSYAF